MLPNMLLVLVGAYRSSWQNSLPGGDVGPVGWSWPWAVASATPW